jgi:hypothetical protein
VGGHIWRLIDLPLVEIVLASVLAAAIVLALVIWFIAEPMTPLILKRASASRSSGQWRDDDYDVLENGVVVDAFPRSRSRRQTAPPGCGRAVTRLARSSARPTAEPTREAAMAAFAKSWRRQYAHAPPGYP